MNQTNKVSPIPDNDEMTIEAISVDEEGNIDPISFEYNEYRSDLNRIYKTTNEMNSILSIFTIDNDICKHVLTIKYNNGMQSTEKNQEFKYTDSFKNNFIVQMIDDFCKYNSVKEVKIEENNNVYELRLLTMDNDRLVINNIDLVFAKQLEGTIYRNNHDNPNFVASNKPIDESGNGNAGIIILTIVLIGLLVLGCIYFMIKTR